MNCQCDPFITARLHVGAFQELLRPLLDALALETEEVPASWFHNGRVVLEIQMGHIDFVAAAPNPLCDLPGILAEWRTAA